MKKIILFGAGDGGLAVKKALSSECEIIVFVDNDESKVGGYLDGQLIISPYEIKKYKYDYIIISNIHGDEVKKQLISNLNVKENQIIDYYHNQLFDTRIATLRLISDEIYSNEIQGDVAELGVYKGEFSKYINESFKDKKFFLFDTFEGFNKEDINKEIENKYSNVTTNEFNDTSIDIVLNKMKFSENCIVKKGYFPKTALDVKNEFCFVSIDVDLYVPILEGLKYFYPRLLKGGYIMIHDYNSTRFFGTKQAVREYCKVNQISYVPINDLCGSIVITK